MTTNTHPRPLVRRSPLRTKLWQVLITVVMVAVPAAALGPMIWPPADMGVEPTAGQIAAFIALGLGDALFLGFGVAFLIFGLSVIRQVSPDSRLRAWGMYLSIGYLLISWWPHTGMHASNGNDLGRLLVIDYTFHLPLEIAGVVLAVSVLSLLVERTGAFRPAEETVDA